MNKTYRTIFISDVHLGTKDVVDQGITGFMVPESVGLRAAVDQCIMMDRAQVEHASPSLVLGKLLEDF